MTSEVNAVGRKRSAKYAWLPRHVHADKCRFVYRPDRSQPPVRLCPITATRAEVFAALADYLAIGRRQDTFQWLSEQFLKSGQFREKSPGTQSQYRKNHNTVCNFQGKNDKYLGNARYDKFTPGLIRKYLDKRAAQGAPVAGNRERAYMSAVFSWAYDRDLVTTNPCRGVKRNTEKARTRYVTDAEYQFAYRLAKAYMKPLMELAYLLYARKSEVLALTAANLREEGMFVERLKGSKSNVVQWSPRLRAAVTAARLLPPQIPQKTIVHNTRGNRINESTVDSAWQRLMSACAAAGPDFQRFTLHDLKAKGITDQIKEQNSAGHKSEQVRQSYIRKPGKVEPPR